MSLQVIKSGTSNTVQDLGRWGFQSQGVPVGGAMDEDSLIKANLLVGNEWSSACLEIFSGPNEWRVVKDSLIALTGKGVNLFIESQKVPANQSLWIKNGTILKMKPTANGSWGYLAIGGGIRADKIMNSRATYLPAGFGGMDGKVLQAGDMVESNNPSDLTSRLENSLSEREKNYRSSGWGIAEPNQLEQDTIRVMKGPDWIWLSKSGQEKLTGAEFFISPDSSRMGYRLKGSPLGRINQAEMISSPVTAGTVQLTNDGSLIILMADGQTVGGYPRVAQVTAVDLPKLAQRRVGESVHFRAISFKEGEQLFLTRERERKQIKHAIQLKIQAG